MKNKLWLRRAFPALLAVGIVLLFAACTDEKTAQQEAAAEYVSISQEEAKRIMDSDDSVVVLDVRTQAEYDEGHIENAILIPHDVILEQAPSVLTDESQTILVYCRSGNRSKVAAKTLATMGYTNVKEFGGISTWEYGTVR
ncbi:MAG: rhodanese-like domain-containing protein [Oscillospiraceae bacterium]|nr:rhodanese-like domain-containing protein [Oscillospiraceae bacterium]